MCGLMAKGSKAVEGFQLEKKQWWRLSMLDTLKKIDLVAFMSACWQVEFKREGKQYVGRSPFREEASASLYVSKKEDGHWVYCDHGSGDGGTIIDAVMAYEGCKDVGQAVKRAKELVDNVGLLPGDCRRVQEKTSKPNLENLVRKLRVNDREVVRGYLMERGIAAELVDELISSDVAMLNRVEDTDYCCMAVHDTDGRLRGLYNRKIKGRSSREKFLLGEQHVFCLDWKQIPRASQVIICEGIIDAISIRTLDRDACILALPGANFKLENLPSLGPEVRLIEAFDRDKAGRGVAARLRQRYPRHTIDEFDHQGAHDVNELLCSGKETTGREKLSLENRIRIALSDSSSRKAAEQHGVHHSRVCAIRKDAATTLQEVWKERRPGPKAKPHPTPDQESLEQQLQEMKHEKELLEMRTQWLELQLKMAERRNQTTDQAGKKKRRRK